MVGVPAPCALSLRARSVELQPHALPVALYVSSQQSCVLWHHGTGALLQSHVMCKCAPHPLGVFLLDPTLCSCCYVPHHVSYCRPIQRFWVLETVARIPYFAYISILHLYESLGFWRAGADLRRVHFAEEWNELHHLQVRWFGSAYLAVISLSCSVVPCALLTSTVARLIGGGTTTCRCLWLQTPAA